MNRFKKPDRKTVPKSVWARPEMKVVYRAELMPGKNREERTFRIENILSNGRVTLRGFSGEHRENAFEPINFAKEK